MPFREIGRASYFNGCLIVVTSLETAIYLLDLCNNVTLPVNRYVQASWSPADKASRIAYDSGAEGALKDCASGPDPEVGSYHNVGTEHLNAIRTDPVRIILG